MWQWGLLEGCSRLTCTQCEVRKWPACPCRTVIGRGKSKQRTGLDVVKPLLQRLSVYGQRSLPWTLSAVADVAQQLAPVNGDFKEIHLNMFR